MSDNPVSVPPLTLHQNSAPPPTPPAQPFEDAAVAPFWSVMKWVVGIGAAVSVVLVLLLMLALAVMYPRLPSVSTLQDYRPKLPLRIYSSDGVLIGEYGQERRQLVRIQDIPDVMKGAILAAEDARFYAHNGIDIVGLARAGLANLRDFRSQGASTITMQVARNVYLSSEKTVARKLYEILLTWKLEAALSKDQILEIYMNQIFLGNRSYGFAAAAENYYGKTLAQLSIAEATMLAGLPKAPTAFNPLRNYKRAKERQEWIIERMVELQMIKAEQAAQAKAEVLEFRRRSVEEEPRAGYVAEMARQLMFSQYKEEAYTRGFNVITSVHSKDQIAAWDAVRKALIRFDRQRSWRGPEGFLDIPKEQDAAREAVAQVFNTSADSGEYLTALVWEADSRKVVAELSTGESITISGSGLARAAVGLRPSSPQGLRIRRGSILRVIKDESAGGVWTITQLPEVQGAFVALDPKTGAIRALIGGFDAALAPFNRGTQAYRQPGSSFKPFIYSAALEHGMNPGTYISDRPIRIVGGAAGGGVWAPKNADGSYTEALSMRQALARSRNMVSIRILQKVKADVAQEYVSRFGFEPARNPPYLTMALGAGDVTPLEMAVGYAAFANGGYSVRPWVIDRVLDHKGRVISAVHSTDLTQAQRIISERNAFVMSTMLNDVARVGTARAAQIALRRDDIYGKTGTTNDAYDVWFVGYQPTTLVAAAWLGYDKPRSLGDHESGGGLALPIWVDFMRHVLEGVPVAKIAEPVEGLVLRNDWVYTEDVGKSIRSIGVVAAAQNDTTNDGDASGNAGPVAPEALVTDREREQILNMFQ